MHKPDVQLNEHLFNCRAVIFFCRLIQRPAPQRYQGDDNSDDGGCQGRVKPLDQSSEITWVALESLQCLNDAKESESQSDKGCRFAHVERWVICPSKMLLDLFIDDTPAVLSQSAIGNRLETSKKERERAQSRLDPLLLLLNSVVTCGTGFGWAIR